ncbi:ribonuclease E inhibitor RraB [Parasphingorhabdus sp.]|uniref:ribonuclease E inhibitor RraB n=1 Tax=Parasphingorhabdus sp. TaxID=2709688 RepID=UPI003D2D980D
MIFPDDDDGRVLKGLFERGVDLQKPRLIEFYCYCKEHHVKKIADKFEEAGLSPEIFEDKESEDTATRYSIYGSKKMVPQYDKIIGIQIQLNEVLKEFETKCDGWGTLSTPSEQ